MRKSLFIVAPLLVALFCAGGSPAAPAPQTAQATFVVHCYDVGADALRGKPGVIAVERGWSGPREIDRVVYRPAEVTVEQLENWLKAAGTFVSTLDAPAVPPSKKELSP